MNEIIKVIIDYCRQARIKSQSTVEETMTLCPEREKCSNCKYFHRLKHNFVRGQGFEESYACDVILHLPDSNKKGEGDVEPWIQEVDLQGMCEMFTDKDEEN